MPVFVWSDWDKERKRKVRERKGIGIKTVVRVKVMDRFCCYNV